MKSILSGTVIVCSFSLFGSEFNLDESQNYITNVSIEHLVVNQHIELKQFGCLNEIFFKNRVKPNLWTFIGQKGIESQKYKSHVLHGTTFWINEHAAVGHLMYDIHLLQILQSFKVDRIVLQRAPCTTFDLCQGIGTWNSFYKGYYLIALRAAQWCQSGELAVYLRFKEEEVALSPYSLSKDGWDLVKQPTASSSGIAKNIKMLQAVETPPNAALPQILLNQDSMCFDQLVRRGSDKHSFRNSIGPDAVKRFKQAANEYLHHVFPDRVTPSERVANSTGPLIITYACRGITATRHNSNTSQVVTALRRTFTGSSITHTVQVVDTSNNSWSFADQMLLAASTDIFVTEHGAFESNMIYMRSGGCVVELRGNYSEVIVESENYAHLGVMFGVKHLSVVLSNLAHHRDHTGYVMTGEEVEQMVILVRNCVKGDKT